MIEVEISKDVYLECYHHIIDGTAQIDIELIYGGRDSGKSKFIAQHLTEESLRLDYFRCLLIKKTHNSIQGAQWQMLKDTAEQWQVDQLYKFRTSPLSIACRNKNTFDARGMEDPGKIRSFSNPSHAWVEEANQLSEDDFITIISGLRNDYGPVKLYLTFNPESEDADYHDFWLYKMFFKKHEPELSFTGSIVMEVMIEGEKKTVALNYRVTHVTYHDNPYVSPQRIAFHESLRNTNYYWYRVFTLGLWGNKLNESPYAYAFDEGRHVSDGKHIPHPQPKRSLPLWLSWDFNRNPMTCLVAQHDEETQTFYLLEVIRLPKSGVDGMCEYINVYYPKFLYIVTGDYNGDNESSLYEEYITHYVLIQQYLHLSDDQIRIRPNPKQSKNSTFLNTVLSYYNIIIHCIKAKALVFDYLNVKRRADGTILKTDRDKAEQQADALDTSRYLFNEVLDGWKPTDEQVEAKAREPQNMSAFAQLAGNIHPGSMHVDYNKRKTVVAVFEGEAELAIKAVALGNLVTCSKFDYWHDGVRNALLMQAGQWVDEGDGVRAQLALMEVKRLDELFG